MIVYLLVRAEHGKEGLVRATLTKFEEIVELYEVFGRYDIVAKVDSPSNKDFSKFIRNRVRVLEGIKSIETLFASVD